MKYKFAQFVADTDRHVLLDGGRHVPLQGRAFAVLVELLAAQGRMVGKDRLVEIVWQGRAVSDSAVTSQIKALRKALGDTGRPYRVIATVHGKGFRIVPPVTTDKRPAAHPSRDAGKGNDEAERGKAPTIAVLPFAFASEGGDHAPVADALPADIIAALSRLRWLQVIARASSFSLGRTQPDPGTLRGELGADYCVMGSVRAAANSFSIYVELVETDSQRLVWAETYDLPHGEVLSLREAVVTEIIHRIGVHITDKEAARARAKPASSLSAWELYHLGMSDIVGRQQADYHAAIDSFRASIAIAPDFAKPYAGLARAEVARIFNAGDGDLDAALANAREMSERAVDLDNLDPFANLVKSQSLRMSHDLAGGRIFGERAIDLAPNFADALYMLSGIELFDGNYRRALECADRARILDPRNPLGFEVEVHRAFAAMHLGKHEDALAAAERLQADPVARNSQYAMGAAITAFHHAGELQRAGELAQAMGAIDLKARNIALTRVFPPSAAPTLEAIVAALAVHRPDLFG